MGFIRKQQSIEAKVAIYCWRPDLLTKSFLSHTKPIAIDDDDSYLE